MDKVNYKRSESGTMYIDSEYGFAKKYLEYKPVDNNLWNESDFILKFNICQNDKACQTDFENTLEEDEKEVATVETKNSTHHFFFPDDEDDLIKLSDDCSVMNEILWSCEPKHCDKCNNKTTAWGNSCVVMDKQMIDGNIWNGGDVCLSCLTGNYQPLNQQQTELREDVSHDGEQLLSDLSSLQKCYMEEEGEEEELPSVEVSCDISEMIEPKDRKRRHSNFYDDINWSFASRLKEDCFIQMSTLPTLRSVTL